MPQKIKCRICGEEYYLNRTSAHWKNNPKCKEQELKIRRQEEKKLLKFSCDLCNLKFKSKKSLTIHKKKIHKWKSDKEKYGITCKVCNKKYMSLKNHIKTHMSVEKYESLYGVIELAKISKEKYSQQNKINAKNGWIKQLGRLKNSEYKKWYGKQISDGINKSEKAIEVRRQNMIKLNKSDKQKIKASNRLKNNRKNYNFNLKCHKWQNNKEKLNAALLKGFINRKDKIYSTYENNLYNWLKSFDVKNIIKNDRIILSGKELDIYLPDYNVAIEFDGLYWHSDKFKEKNYHLNKTIECEKQGIQLLHIFEDEWKSKEEIVKNRLKNILGLNSKRIGARKCTIKEITSKEKNIFLDKYHIQGKDRSSVKLGAYNNNKLIGVMTFGKLRIFMNKKATKGSYELSRFVTIPDTYTPGLASKMLKYFERNWNPKLIETFADRRWSQGNLYNKLGFDLAGQTAPNYWYSRSSYIRYHRYSFRKSELKEFNNYSSKKTEKQIMKEAGWHRIYDCGNYKFIKHI